MFYVVLLSNYFMDSTSTSLGTGLSQSTRRTSLTNNGMIGGNGGVSRSSMSTSVQRVRALSLSPAFATSSSLTAGDRMRLDKTISAKPALMFLGHTHSSWRPSLSTELTGQTKK